MRFAMNIVYLVGAEYNRKGLTRSWQNWECRINCIITKARRETGEKDLVFVRINSGIITENVVYDR